MNSAHLFSPEYRKGREDQKGDWQRIRLLDHESLFVAVWNESLSALAIKAPTECVPLANYVVDEGTPRTGDA